MMAAAADPARVQAWEVTNVAGVEDPPDRSGIQELIVIREATTRRLGHRQNVEPGGAKPTNQPVVHGVLVDVDGKHVLDGLRIGSPAVRILASQLFAKSAVGLQIGLNTSF